MSDVAAQHRVPLLITGSVLFVVLLAFVQVPLCGYGPNLAKKLWTVIVRWWKKGDVRPWTWTCVEGGVIYVSSLPRHIDEITALQASPHNVGAVISLVDEWEIKVPGEQLRAAGIEWLHLPTPDYSAPSMRHIRAGVQFIIEHVARGKGVLVHCNAGRGRSVVIVLAYMLARHRRDHLTRDAAFEALAARREIAEMRSLCGTRPQWRAVGAFERELQVHAHEWAAAEQAAANLALALRQQVSWPSPLPLPAHGVSHGVQDAALRASVQVQRTSFTAQDQDGVYPTGGSTAWVDAGAGGAGADSGCGADGMGREGDANHEELRAPAEFSASDLLGTTGVGGDTAAVASEGESDPALPGQTSSLQRPATSQQT